MVSQQDTEQLASLIDPVAKARAMSTNRHLPIPTPRLHQLIRQAMLDVKRARGMGDSAGVVRSERRMNTLLDQLAKRTPTAGTQLGSRVCA